MRSCVPARFLFHATVFTVLTVGFSASSLASQTERSAFRPLDSAARPVVRTTAIQTALLSSDAFFSAGWMAPEFELPHHAAVVDLPEDDSSGAWNAGGVRRPSEREGPQWPIRLEASAALTEGDRVQLFREERVLEGIGRIVRPTALGVVHRVDGLDAVVQILQVYGRVADGDWVRPAPEFPISESTRTEPVDRGATGSIVAFVDPRGLFGLNDVAVLDLGAVDGLRVGDRITAWAGAGDEDEEAIAYLRIVGVTSVTASAQVEILRSTALGPGATVRVTERVR